MDRAIEPHQFLELVLTNRGKHNCADEECPAFYAEKRVSITIDVEVAELADYASFNGPYAPRALERNLMDWKSASTKDDGAISIPDSWLHLHYYEALNILFRMENSLRVFVYVVFKNKFQEKWTETALQTVDEATSTIAATAAKRLLKPGVLAILGMKLLPPSCT